MAMVIIMVTKEPRESFGQRQPCIMAAAGSDEMMSNSAAVKRNYEKENLGEDSPAAKKERGAEELPELA
eukprot:11741014-Karenia_brevis.AAC.1